MDASMIVAITGAIVGLGGLLLNLRGQSAQRIEQQAANAALANKARLEETQQALDASTKRAETAEAGERLWREETVREREKSDRLEAELDEQRELHRHQLSRQEARCREQTALLTDALIVLREVVVDETAQAAAATVLDRRLPHPHEPPELEQRAPGDES